MPNEKELFQTTGKSWSELAVQGELDAVLTGSGKVSRNLFLHHTQLVAAKKACRLMNRHSQVVDFGCGTGRFVRFFAERGHSVLGTEITPEMLQQARRFGIPKGSNVILTNGIAIPVADETIDLIWVCGVLRYSLNVPNPVYDQIAREMYRALKPGGCVVNLEMYVDQPSSDFSSDFEVSGFRTESVRIINRHFGRYEKKIQSGLVRAPFIAIAAKTFAHYRYHFDPADSTIPGLRDYFFVWRKP